MRKLRISENIGFLKEKNHLRQQDIMDVTGVSKGTVSKWCDPNMTLNNPNEYLDPVADLLKVSVEDLLYRDFQEEEKKMKEDILGTETYSLMEDNTISLYNKSKVLNFDKDTDDLYEAACFFAEDESYKTAIYYGESALINGNLEAGFLLLDIYKDYFNSFNDEERYFVDPEGEEYEKPSAEQKAVKEEFVSKLSDYGSIMNCIVGYRNAQE